MSSKGLSGFVDFKPMSNAWCVTRKLHCFPSGDYYRAACSSQVRNKCDHMSSTVSSTVHITSYMNVTTSILDTCIMMYYMYYKWEVHRRQPDDHK